MSTIPPFLVDADASASERLRSFVTAGTHSSLWEMLGGSKIVRCLRSRRTDRETWTSMCEHGAHTRHQETCNKRLEWGSEEATNKRVVGYNIDTDSDREETKAVSSIVLATRTPTNLPSTRSVGRPDRTDLPRQQPQHPLTGPRLAP